MNYELSALDEVSGEALVSNSDGWFFLSEMTGWSLVRLAGDAEATRHVVSGRFVVKGEVFQDLDELIESVRLDCNQACPITDVALSEIIQYCPLPILQKWKRVTAERERSEPAPPLDVGDPFTRIWHALVELAGGFTFHRTEAQDLASQALLALTQLDAYAPLRSALHAESSLSHVMEGENYRTFARHAYHFFREVKYWREGSWSRPAPPWPPDWPRWGYLPLWRWWPLWPRRRENTFPHLSIEQGEVDEEELVDRKTLAPDDELSRLELLDLVQTALRRLESEVPMQHQVVLEWMQGYSSQEIAEILSVSLSKVYHDRDCAFKRLKKILQELGVNAANPFH